MKHLISTCLRKVPVTLGLLSIAWAAYLACVLSGAAPREAFGLRLPVDPDLWHWATAGLTAGNLVGLILATVAALLFAVPAEVRLGSARFAVAATASEFVALPFGFIIGSAIERAGFNLWGPDLANETFVSPVAWIFGPAAFATAFMGVLWRRRLRLVLLAMMTTLVLYDGSLSGVVALVAIVAGTVAGVLVTDTGTPRRMSLREARVLVAALFLSVAIGPVITAINPAAQGPFAGVSKLMWEPTVAGHLVAQRCADATSVACAEAMAVNSQHGLGPLLMNALPIVLSAILALGLVHGRKLAWWAAVLVSVGSIAVICWQTIGGGADGSTAVNTILVVLPWLVTIAVLIATRRRFTVPSNWYRGAAIIGGPWLATAALWTCGAWVVRDGFLGGASISALLAELPNRYLPPVVAVLAPTHAFPISSVAWIFYEWVGIIFWITALIALFEVLSAPPSEAHAQDHQRAREILVHGSGDHLAWMGLWERNRYFFCGTDSGDGEGVVAYRVSYNVAVTVGSPVHRGTMTEEAVASAFEEFAARQGWRVAWYSVPGTFARPDFRRIHVAEESMLLTDNIEFKGKKFQNIRTARNRAAKEGVRAVWTSWAESPVEMRERIVALSEQWVADKALPEMGFTLGGLDELRDPDTKLLLAVGDDGSLHAVTSWLPVYEGGALVGYTLDFMRRDANGFRPAIEFLLAESARIAAEQGLGWVSLSGAPLARTDAPESLVEIILDKAGATIEPLYGFRSLAASKHKFHPTHQGWYLLYEDEMSLANISLAVIHCYLPDMKKSDMMTVVKEFLGRPNLAQRGQIS